MGSCPLAVPDMDVLTLDPNNFPAADADAKLLEFWNMHGHLYSSRYTNPEITSFSAILRLNAKTCRNSTAYLVPTDDSMTAYRKVTYFELDRLVSKVAAHYAEIFVQEFASANENGAQLTIAMVGVGITFDYFITIMALLRLHVRVLLLSNKNAKVAHEHLLDQCNAIGCIADTANLHAVGTKDENGFHQEIVPLVSIDDPVLDKVDIDSIDIRDLGYQSDDEWNLHSVIIHSSGTTGMPKPIVHTNRSITLIARHHRLFRDFYIENFQICAPLFHVGGFSVAIGGLPLGLSAAFPPPNWPPATSAILRGWNTLEAMNCPVDAAQIAPALVEDIYAYISSTTNDFGLLSKLKVLQSGGAPFAPALLAKLVALGVNMKTIYGQTEIAGPMRTLPHSRDNQHMARLRNLYDGTGWVALEDLGAGDGSAECVVYKGFPLAAELWEKPDAPNPYRTNDILREDPPGSGYWVLVGRKDDVIVHSNGEKTMGGGVATSLQGSHPVIFKAAVYGSNRPCTAVIIEVRWAALSSKDAADPSSVEELVWDAVQSVNKQIPIHSRIDRSLVLILGRGENLPITPKGTVKRKIAWDTFGPRVDELFEKFLQDGWSDGGNGEVTPISALDNLSDSEYVQACLQSICNVPRGFDWASKTFYEVGLDSQRAVRLRAMLVKRFGAFPLMFIFENPTLGKLVAYLENLKSHATHSTSSFTVAPNDTPAKDEKLEWIQKTIETYSRIIDGWKAMSSSLPSWLGTSQIVYVTGANGALGNALVEAFVKSPTVSKIYCAVRGSPQDVQGKLVKALESRGYTSDISQSPKLHAVPYSMTDVHLGLDEETYAKLQSEVTMVLHNAWRLDFNQPVMMYEPDCLKSVMNLLLFSISGQKKIFSYTSSVSAVMGPAAAGNIVIEEPAGGDPRTPAGTGYAQSKYISERVTQHFAAAMDVPVRLMRVGQLCGHSVRGKWSESEMYPIMMATGLDHLHAMPLFPGASERFVNWLPVDACGNAAAKSLLAAPGNSQDCYVVHNLVNPNVVTWDAFLDLLEMAASGDNTKKPFTRVPIAQWATDLEKLAEGEDDRSFGNVPGLKLLGYFQAMANAPARKQAQVVTKTIVNQPALDVPAVKKWLQRWQESGFLKE